MLTNLLGNAIRHTPTGGHITVSAEQNDGKVVLTVHDTGAGIPPNYLESIFERFTQVPGATRGGAGLGLSLARSIVTAHGGEIRAASEGEGKGSTFIVTLPQSQEDSNG
ncbi:MAG: ATP-binding protein [Armatimonas sp.]